MIKLRDFFWELFVFLKFFFNGVEVPFVQCPHCTWYTDSGIEVSTSSVEGRKTCASCGGFLN